MGYTGQRPSAIPLSGSDIVDGSVTNDDLAGSITSAKITSLDATKLTGTVAPARMGSGTASSTTVLYGDGTYKAEPVTDLTPLRQDINILAIREAVTENKAAYNLPNSFIDHFQDSTGLTTLTDVTRNASEFVDTEVTSVAAFSDDANTTLLLHMDDASLIDSSSINTNSPHTTTPAGDAARSTAVTAKFGTHSLLCDGTGDWLRVADSADWDFGTGDFTVEAWIYPTAHGAYRAFIGSGSWGGPNYDWLFDITSANPPTIRWHLYNGSDAPATSDATTVALNTWTHLAACRSGTTTTVYIGGVAHGTLSGAHNITSNGDLYIGARGGAGEPWQGHIDEVRFSDNARYSGTFTPNEVTVVNATGTLISDQQTVPLAITKMSGVILYKENSGDSVLGTHLKIYFSATGTGASDWVEATYTEVTAEFSSGIKMARLGSTTVPSGTLPTMKAVWASQVASSLETQLHGWAMNY